ncbi:MAG TPA: hypothetical protein VK358_12650 [Longimicrobium sp.]|nr:hypothetical protein [Longimicrobium sp.]
MRTRRKPISRVLSSYPIGNAVTCTYTSRGEPESLALPGGIAHRYTYNAGGQLEHRRVWRAAPAGARAKKDVLCGRAGV